MIKSTVFSVWFVLLTGLVFSQSTADFGWPQEIVSGTDTIVVYQPQVQSWQNNMMNARSAVQYTRSGQEPAFGILNFNSRTETDLTKNLVYLDDIQIESYDFPILPDHGKALSEQIRSELANRQCYMYTDQVKNSLSVDQVMAKSKTDVNNDPPTIYYSDSPAVLVLVDGDPVKQPISGSSYQRIINCSSLLLFEPGKGDYKMSLFGKWFTSRKLEGPWKLDLYPGKDLTKTGNSILKSDTSIQTFDPPSEEIGLMLEQAESPRIFVSTGPAELIVTDGTPKYQPISNTNLLYVTNTSSDMFKYVSDNMTYVLISGRWFKASDIHGTWTFVPPNQLPDDFKKIPQDHPKGSVLASVAGTPQADEAVISSQIPQTATINRQQATMHATYDGNPNFKPIQGTNLQYAVNSPNPVIMDNNSYYSVNKGVWYNAASPNGPWNAAVSVPPAIYTIPASSPIHYVTYVYVYGYTPSYIYTGYTPGYYGCYVNPYGTVVYGTGYRYHPWVGNRWYGRPYSYGLGVNFSWSNWAGWGMNFGFGHPYYPVHRPWWGPIAYSPHRPYVNHSQINVYNYNRQGVVHYNHPVNYHPYHTTPSHGYVHTSHAVPAYRNNYFAGNNGHVYRTTSNGSWHVNNGSGWRPVQQHPQMTHQFQIRQQGNLRVQTQHNFHNTNNTFNHINVNHNNMYQRPSGFNSGGFSRPYGGGVGVRNVGRGGGMRGGHR